MKIERVILTLTRLKFSLNLHTVIDWKKNYVVDFRIRSFIFGPLTSEQPRAPLIEEHDQSPLVSRK